MMILNMLSIVILGTAMGRLMFYSSPVSSSSPASDILLFSSSRSAVPSSSLSIGTSRYVLVDNSNIDVENLAGNSDAGDVMYSHRSHGSSSSNNNINKIRTKGNLRRIATSRTSNSNKKHSVRPLAATTRESDVEMEETTHPQETYRLHVKQPMTKEHMAYLRGPDGPKYNVLVTGAAGFVGMHTSIELARLGLTPIGYDNVNSYYSTDLKEQRVQQLQNHNITFVRGDVCDVAQLIETIQLHNITRVIHLAAQAGVRYSLDHPLEYTHNNIDCTVKLFEVMVKLGITEQPLIYASSSSVYGNNVKVPFKESDPVEDPASLYATTKRTNELLARTYYNLYNMSSIGLRFFTVYGPYGRPDMAPWIFTDKIMNNETIPVFNNGKSKRDFTYVDDIVQGVVNSLLVDGTGQPELINLGNGKPIVLADFVRVVEENVGRVADKNHMPMQQGDVPVTYADISKATYLLAYNPSTTIETGIRNFVYWFQQHEAWLYRMTTSTKSEIAKSS